jgi:hypothetical protein
MQVFDIPITQFRSSHELMTYGERVYVTQTGLFNVKKRSSIENARAAKCGKYEFSVNAKKRFKRASNNLSLLCRKAWKHNPYSGRMQPHEATMLTFTVPQSETLDGREAMENLWKPFMKFITRYAKTDKMRIAYTHKGPGSLDVKHAIRSGSNGHGIRNYVWKTEKQKRGQLHWHLITDSMVDILECRRKWNRLLSRNGYFKGKAPSNSVDVVSFTAARVALYLAKELAKQEQNPVGLSCKVWGCSEGLEMPYFSLQLNSVHLKRLDKLKQQGRVKTKVDTDGRWMFHWLKEDCNAQTDLLSEAELNAFNQRILDIGAMAERALIELPEPIVINEEVAELPPAVIAFLNKPPPKPIQPELFDTPKLFIVL